MPSYTAVVEIISAIESELKRLGWWQANPLPVSAFVNMGAFGMNTMAPTQWIQFVFIPNVKRLIDEKGTLPKTSDVGVWAMRNFDGDERADTLCQLLSEFDALFLEP